MAGHWPRAYWSAWPNPLLGRLDAVALAIEEDEDFSRERVFAQFVADDDAEGVEAFAQVAGAGGQADLDAVGEDHGWTLRAE